MFASASQYPSLSLDLIPIFDSSHNATALSICMTIGAPALDTDDALLILPLQLANVPSQRYDGFALQASDDSGALSLHICDSSASDPQRYWLVRRPTHGDVTIQYRALPRRVDEKTPIGPRVDLRHEHGGLQGSGLTVIPIPPSSASKERLYTLSVQWDLAAAPEGTRAVWTFGEGPEPVKRIGPASLLANCIYAVGPIKSYPAADGGQRDRNDYAFYWFGNPPAIITSIAQPNKRLFRQMSTFFRDPGISPYRVFVRNASPARGFGGTAFVRSYMLEYDAAITSVSEDEIFLLLAHEMVHNWPLLGKKADAGGSAEDIENNWYSEGIADYYAATLPYRFGIRDKEWFVKAMNVMLSPYYTNPLVHISSREAAARASQTAHAQRLPYKRGFTYLVHVNAQIQKGSGGKRCVDDLVLALLERKTNGRPFGVKEWLFLLKAELGKSAIHEYNDMAAGKLVVPAKDCLGSDFKLVRRDQEMYELGFAESSLNSRQIVGLVAGSRAAEAGLKEGDKILKNTFLWQSADDYEQEMRVIVQRVEGEREEMEVEYWPRGWEKVESYQWVRT